MELSANPEEELPPKEERLNEIYDQDAAYLDYFQDLADLLDKNPVSTPAVTSVASREAAPTNPPDHPHAREAAQTHSPGHPHDGSMAYIESKIDHARQEAQKHLEIQLKKGIDSIAEDFARSEQGALANRETCLKNEEHGGQKMCELIQTHIKYMDKMLETAAHDLQAGMELVLFKNALFTPELALETHQQQLNSGQINSNSGHTPLRCSRSSSSSEPSPIQSRRLLLRHKGRV
jgi:hypothetical protein